MGGKMMRGKMFRPNGSDDENDQHLFDSSSDDSSSEEEEEEQEIQNLLSDFPVLQTNVRIKKRSKMLTECLMDGLMGNLYLHFSNKG